MEYSPADALASEQLDACCLNARRWSGFLSRFLSAGASSLQGLILLWLIIEDHDNLFVMSEFVHFAGIGALLWKLIKQRNSGGTAAGPSSLCWNLNAKL